MKGPLYKVNHDYGTVSTHSAVDKDVHAFKRRVLGHAFSEQSLRNLEPLMIENIEKWLDALNLGATEDRKGGSAAKAMAPWAHYLTCDGLGSLCFGKAFGLLDSDEFRDVPALMVTRGVFLNVVCSIICRCSVD